MPKNSKGGKAFKKTKNGNTPIEREFLLKEEGQEYALVNRELGNGRVEAYCYDGETRLCHLRGNLKKKKVYIKVGDIILVSLRDYQDKKADVIHKYNADEARKLKNIGELPENAVINATEKFGDEKEEEIPFDFDTI